MKIKEIAKTLANKINQEHYIMHYLEKIQRGAYNKGFKDAQSKKLTLTDVSQQRELLLAYENYTSEMITGKTNDRTAKSLVNDFLANNCG